MSTPSDISVPPKRRYEKRRRAELEAQTRRRITESAVALHGTLGPARTSMSALAEHAGVTRSTLYRHFADDAAVLAACSAHWAEQHPLPDPAGWAAIEDPDARLRAALGALFALYGDQRGMLANLHRDEAVDAAVAAVLAGWHGYLDAVAGVLLAGRAVRGRARERTRAALRHAVAFPTWASLVAGQGLRDEEAVELLCGLVRAAR